MSEVKRIVYESLPEPVLGYCAELERHCSGDGTVVFMGTVGSYGVRVVFRDGGDVLVAWECSCPSFRNRSFRKGSPYRMCKHLVGLLKRLGQARGRFSQWEPVMRGQTRPPVRVVQQTAADDWLAVPVECPFGSLWDDDDDASNRV